MRLPGSDVGFQTDDRQDLGGLGFAEKLDGSVHVSVIGQGQRGHAQSFGAFEQIRDLACAVQEAVMAVAMEMDERRGSDIVVLLMLRLPERLCGAGKPRPWVAGRSASSRS